MKLHALLSLSLLAASCASADTINQVAQEIKQSSVLSLHQNVASFWAGNLLDAQTANPQLNSLDLSILAVLKAISIERDVAGLAYCNLTNCVIANAQSTIAIDPNAGIGFSSMAVDFGEVPVQTPEPATWLLALIGVVFVRRLKCTFTSRANQNCGQ